METKIPEKVKEPKIDDLRSCYRCDQDYCSHCVDFIEVDFEVRDSPEGYERITKEWKGEKVCSWCYNQLIDLFTKKNRDEEVNFGKLVWNIETQEIK